MKLNATKRSAAARARLMAKFARDVKALLPVAERLASDEFTREDRAELRRLAGISRSST